MYFLDFEVREAFKNDPEARGFVFPKYEPVASHGDPIHAPNDLNFSNLYVPYHVFFQTRSQFLIFGRVLWGG